MSFEIPLYWKPPDWIPPPGFPSLPVCWEWHEGEELPPFVEFVKGDLDEPMYFKVCLESFNPPKISITKRNIAQIIFRVGRCLGWFFRFTPAPEDYVNKCTEYVRQYHTRFDIEVDSDIKEEQVCFEIPANWKLKAVLKNNVPTPFTRSDNMICFTLTHESPTLVTLQLTTPTEETLETVQNTTLTLSFLVMVMFMLMQLVTTITRTFKE